jgi:polar amino acid transport system substrate-binding protein
LPYDRSAWRQSQHAFASTGLEVPVDPIRNCQPFGQIMMRKLCALMITVIVLITVRPAHANQLDDIRAAGVLRAAVFDSNPPFGSKATVSHELVCYDVDFAAAIAKHIGVKLKLLATNPSNRIPLLQAGKADLIVAYLTITHRRAEVIEFSIPYFRTGVQLMVRTEDSNRFEDFIYSRIGVVRNTTQEEYLSHDFRAAKRLVYDDTPQAMEALRNGSVAAVAQDHHTLASFLATAPDRARFKILPIDLTEESVGIGILKNRKELLDAVNGELLELEKSGEAVRIYHKWFGSLGEAVQERNFKIAVPCEALTGWATGNCDRRLP